MRIFLLFILFFYGMVILSRADNLITNQTISLQILHQREDSINSSIDSVLITPIGAEELIKQKVIKWQSERFIYLDDERPDYSSDDVLILLNGRRVKDLPQISDPKLVKEIKILKDELLPMRYRKKGIKSVIKIKTYKIKPISTDNSCN